MKKVHVKSWLSILAFIFVFSPIVTEAAYRTTPDGANFVITGSAISSMVVSTSTSRIYIGGTFTEIGPYSGAGVPLKVADGAASSTYPKFDDLTGTGSINAVVSDRQGGWYVAGLFTLVDSVSYMSLAHVLPSGSIDPNFSPAFPINTTINAIALSPDGSTLYVGGSFTTIGGVTYNRLAALTTSNGAASTTFNPNMGSAVNALQLSSDGRTIYAGGFFTTVGGVTYNRLAAIDTATGVASTTFNPNLNTTVNSLLLSADNRTLYAGGNFATVGGVSYTRLAAISTLNGVASTSFNPVLNSIPSALALSPDESLLYVGGGFTTIGGVAYNRLAAISIATASATPAFNPNVGGVVSALQLSSDGTTLYVGGTFTTVGGVTYNNIAAINTTTASATPAFNPNLNSTVSAVALSSSGETLYAGGLFRAMGSTPRNNLAAISSIDGSVISSFNPNMNNAVGALALSRDGSRLYAGGNFTTVGGVIYNRLAAINTSNGAAISSFNPSVTITSGGAVSALVLNSAETLLYTGGSFTGVGGVTYNRLAAIDTTTASATLSFNPNLGTTLGHSVNSMKLSSDESTLYIGGSFLTVGGVSYTRLAAIRTSDGVASTTFNPVANGTVGDIVLSQDNTKLYAGGSFTSIGGVTYNSVAAVDTVTASATPSYNPNANARVDTVALSTDDSTLYLGGIFSALGGQSSIARLGVVSTANASTTYSTPTIVSGGVSKIILDSLKMYIYGTFTSINGLTKYQKFAMFSAIVAPTITTSSATSLTTTSALLNGSMTDDGYASTTVRGFQYGLTTAYGATTTESGTFGVGSFSSTTSGLSSATEYHFRAYSTNSAGTSYGSDATFTTSPNPPTVTSSSATSLGETSATLNGSLDDTGGEDASVRGFVYGLTDAYGATTTESGSFSTGSFTSSLSSLTCATTYHFAPYAVNSAGTSTYPTDDTFVTSACPIAASFSGGTRSGSIPKNKVIVAPPVVAPAPVPQNIPTTILPTVPPKPIPSQTPPTFSQLPVTENILPKAPATATPELVSESVPPSPQKNFFSRFLGWIIDIFSKS
ncbi:MAG: hypothetical protein V4697_00705 [Patescibacteria group bacterium]